MASSRETARPCHAAGCIPARVQQDVRRDLQTMVSVESPCMCPFNQNAGSLCVYDLSARTNITRELKDDQDTSPCLEQVPGGTVFPQGSATKRRHVVQSIRNAQPRSSAIPCAAKICRISALMREQHNNLHPSGQLT